MLAGHPENQTRNKVRKHDGKITKEGHLSCSHRAMNMNNMAQIFLCV